MAIQKGVSIDVFFSGDDCQVNSPFSWTCAWALYFDGELNAWNSLNELQSSGTNVRGGSKCSLALNYMYMV